MKKITIKLKKIIQRFFWLLFFSLSFFLYILKHPLKILKKISRWFSVFFIFTLYVLKHPLKTFKKISRWFSIFLIFILYALKHPLKTFKKLLKWFLATWPRRLLASFLIILFIIAPLSFLFTRNKVEAAWWNDSWQYRKPIAVTNSSGGALTDFQVKILDNKDLSIDITNGKIQADLDDLRFTDINGKVLQYWIEDTTTTSVDVWAKVSIIPTSGATVYMYYGNAGAPAGKSIVGVQSFPGLSCKAVKLSGGTTDGVYYIDPDGGNISNAYQAYCNMTRDGGGWTLGIKSWYGSGMIGNVNAVGAVADATSHKGNPYKISDADIRSIIGSTQNFDVLADQDGYNSAYSTGNYEYVIVRNYTGAWTYATAVPPSSSTTIFQSYRASDNALAWTGNLGCGYNAGSGVAGINCVDVISNNPQGGAGCNINMGTASNAGWHHFFMNQYNDDTYLYICNGAQHSSSYDLNHRFWFRETSINRSLSAAAAAPGTEEKGTGPVAYWSFDEGQGTIANDSVFPNGVVATGGTITDVNGYRIHTFTSSGTFTVTKGGNAEVLVVGGGGGGGMDMGGGGGGGGVIYSSYAVTATSYTVTVGNGGTGAPAAGTNGQPGGHPYTIPATQGANSTFGTLTAIGGGFGGSSYRGYTPGISGGNGGSGGGSGGYNDNAGTFYGGQGTIGQGNRGGNSINAYYSGGGGGAGGQGTDSNAYADGGAGIQYSNISSYYWGGGGGGAAYSLDRGGNGGIGGGGGGAVGTTTGGAGLNNGQAGGGGSPNSWANMPGGNAGANTGGGGGGGSHYNSNNKGGTGGSGIVIIRYPIKPGNDGALANMSATSSPTSGWQTEDNCVAGKCLAFDGTNDFVDLSSKLVAVSGNGARSIFAWIRTSDPNTYRAIISTGSPADSQAFNLVLYGAVPGIVGVMGYGDDFYPTTGTAVNDGKWHYVGAVYDGAGTIKTYVDGKLDNTGSKTYSTTGQNNYIGKSNHVGNEMYFNGKIDEPKIYNYVRSATQIKLDYNAGIAGTGGAEGAGVSLSGKSSKWMTDGLVGHWKMDETSWAGAAGEVKDASGNNNNGTAAGGVSTTAGKYGNGGNFAGTDDYVSASALANYNFGSALTAEVWFYHTGTAAYRGIINNGYYTSGGFEIRMGSESSGTAVYFMINTSSGIQSVSTTASANTWHHAVLTYDGQNLKVYIDGALAGSAAMSGTLNVVNKSLFIGQNGNNGEYFVGKIDDARVYNRALSPKEVSDLYNYAPGPVGYWNMEEGGGTIANDTSGNGYAGTLTSGPTWTTGKFGKGINFDGTDDYISVPLTLTTSMTVSAWVKLTDFSKTANTLINATPHTTIGISLNRSGGGETVVYLGNGSSWAPSSPSITSSKNMVVNTWYHVSFTSNGTTSNLYIDGVNVGSSNYVPSGFGSYFHIGRIIQSGEFFKGSIDDYKVYNYARTPDQIKEDMLGRGGSSVSDKSTLGYWKFDEGYGGTANNSGSSGSAANGTISGATWSNLGKFGKALSFNGTSSYVSATLPVSGMTQGTLSVWVKFNALGSDADTPIGIGNPGAGKWRIDVYPSGAAAADFWTDGNATSSAGVISTGNWYHLISTFDGTTKRMYVNGVQVASAVSSATPVNASTVQISGYTPGGYIIDGLIDEAKVYNYALTADEVALDYNQGKSITLGSSGTTATGTSSNSADRAYCPPGDTTATCAPVGEWKFEEGANTTANDSSGNGKTGTLTNGPIWTNGKFGKAVKFDGDNDTVSIAGPISAYPFTVSLWATHDLSWNPAGSSGTMDELLNMSIAGQRVSLGIVDAWDANGEMTLMYGGTNHWSAPKPLTVGPNDWHQITWVVYGSNDTNHKIYIDGVSQTMTNRGGAHGGTAGWNIGNNSASSEGWPGKIDNIKIYNYARTPAQVAWDYNRGAPVGWWKMDEGEGLTAHDSSGNNNNGILTNMDGATDWVAGKINKALDFDGSNDVVSIGDKASLKGFNTVTMTAWVKVNAQQTGSVSANSSGGYNFYYNSSSGIRAEVVVAGPIGVAFYGGLLPIGEWKHIAMTYDQQNLRLYIDGVQVNSIAETRALVSQDSTGFRIGEYAGYFNGQIDDVRVYNYALTQDQVEQIYSGGAVNFK